MSEYFYPKAPMYCIDGIPAYKYGEWPGIKSCKFENTRKMIHPKSTGIIFNGNIFPLFYNSFPLEKEPTMLPRRKLLGPGPSPEWEFKPGVKMVKQIHEKKKEKKTAFELFPAKTQGRPFFQKKYYFEKQNEYYQERKLKEEKYLKQHGLLNKNSDAETVGFNKKFFENVSNNKLLGITITKETFNKMMNKTQGLPKIDGTLKEILLMNKFEWKQRQNKKISEMKKEQENLQRDVNYVANLENMIRNYN